MLTGGKPDAGQLPQKGEHSNQPTLVCMCKLKLSCLSKAVCVDEHFHERKVLRENLVWNEKPGLEDSGELGEGKAMPYMENSKELVEERVLPFTEGPLDSRHCTFCEVGIIPFGRWGTWDQRGGHIQEYTVEKVPELRIESISSTCIVLLLYHATKLGEV